MEAKGISEAKGFQHAPAICWSSDSPRNLRIVELQAKWRVSAWTTVNALTKSVSRWKSFGVRILGIASTFIEYQDIFNGGEEKGRAPPKAEVACNKFHSTKGGRPVHTFPRSSNSIVKLIIFIS